MNSPPALRPLRAVYRRASPAGSQGTFYPCSWLWGSSLVYGHGTCIETFAQLHWASSHGIVWYLSPRKHMQMSYSGVCAFRPRPPPRSTPLHLNHATSFIRTLVRMAGGLLFTRDQGTSPHRRRRFNRPPLWLTTCLPQRNAYAVPRTGSTLPCSTPCGRLATWSPVLSCSFVRTLRRWCASGTKGALKGSMRRGSCSCTTLSVPWIA